MSAKKKKLPSKISKEIKNKYYSRSYFADIFEDFFQGSEYTEYKKQKPVKDIFEDLFEDTNKALKTIQSWKPKDNSAKTIKKIVANTTPLTDEIQRRKIKEATTLPGGAVRKQRFLPDKIAPLASRLRMRVNSDGTKSYIASNDKFQNYLFDNELVYPFDMIKAHGKQNKKFKLENDEWDALGVVLRSLNMRPQEVLDYAISSVQTKKRFLELRLYREYENNSKLAINNFINIYKKHLKSKQPLKVFAVSKDFLNWCKEENLYFKSDENLRQNIKLMIIAWNKDNPKDKLPLKIK